MIVFPSVADQPLNTARVAYHRLGLTGDMQTVTVDQARAMIQKVAETDLYRERANHFRDIIRQYDEAQVSVMVVEALLQRLASKPRMTVSAARCTRMKPLVVKRSCQRSSLAYCPSWATLIRRSSSPNL